MNRAQAAALVARNAAACEAAAHPRCKCPCGGRLHGAKHSAEWQAAVADQLATPDVDPQQIELQAVTHGR